MPRRGYPLDGRRAGGITRLAADTGISQATMSRMVNGQGEPSVESLRKIGQVFGYSLSEMMVHAGLVEPGQVQEPAVKAAPAPQPSLADAIAHMRRVMREEIDRGELSPDEIRDYMRQIREAEGILMDTFMRQPTRAEETEQHQQRRAAAG